MEIVGDNGPVRLPAAKQRQVLCALLVRAGETCSADALIDAVWGESPPPSARKLLQIYVSQLRKALPSGAAIVTKGAGYRLDLEPESLDAARFERLLGEGRAVLQEGNAALASSLLGRALALWRGRAYADFAYEDCARVEAERLEELRLVALEIRTEAQLALGRHAHVLGELRALSAEHPLRERVQAQTMLALYRSGRQSEALELYAATRVLLRNELGLEPGAELRGLQRRILQQDPSLELLMEAEEPARALPFPPSALHGRKRELEELRTLFQRPDVRLLVLTGAGGSGKTRLALEIARELASSFANGAALVELAPIRDPEEVVSAISRALEVQEVAGQEPLETLAAALGPRELLLVPDNVEHLRSAAPVFVELLARAPRLKVLATSRVVLHVSGERVYPVDPLPPNAARALFLERARAAKPDFGAAANDESIGRICERLDRLPLAIELASSRVRTLTPAELLARLDARLPLLTDGPRDLPARQQTLRATLEWSFSLLGEGEQRDLTRLAVFAAGCTLEAAEAVCGTTLERLSSLVDHNLLRHTATADGSRYSMLETIQEYALERLEASGEAPEIRRRQLEFIIRLVESANLFAEAEEPQRQELVIPEYENARAAIAWALDAGETELGLRLAVALENFWVTRDPFEGMRVFERLLAADAGAPPALRARALRAFASSRHTAGDVERAEALYRESLRLHRSLGDERGSAIVSYRLGQIALIHGDAERARRLLEGALARFRALGSRRGEAQAVGSLGSLAQAEGNAELAAELYEQSAAMCEAIGRPWWQASMLSNLADLELESGRPDEASRRAREALVLCRRIGDRKGTVYALAYLASAAAASDDLRRAGRLWGAVEAEETRGPVPGWESERERFLERISARRDADLARPARGARALPWGRRRWSAFSQRLACFSRPSVILANRSDWY